MLFANVLKLYEASFALGQNTVIIGVLISWVNLDLGIETCFYQGMNACGKAWLQFVFPLYVILLVLLFIILGSADQWKILRVTRLNVIVSPLYKKTTAFLVNCVVSVFTTLFWAGLSIVVQCIMALVVALAPSNSVQLITLAWISLILIMVVGFLQVYKHQPLNALEVGYFAGLLMLA